MILKNSKTSILKKLLIAFIIYHSSLIIGVAQNLDTLYTIWQDESQSDSTRAKSYNDYVEDGFLYSNPDSAYVLAEALHIYATNHNFSKASAIGYNLQGIAMVIRGNYASALEFFEKSLAIYEELGDKSGAAGIMNNIGRIHEDKGNYPTAIKYYTSSIALKKEIGQISVSLTNIGNVYLAQNNLPRALEYYESGLALSEEAGNKQSTANCLNNIGIIYSLQANYPCAKDYFEESLAIFKTIGDKRGTSNSLAGLGLLYKNKGDELRTIEYLKKTQAIFEEIGDNYGIAKVLSDLGSIYQEQGKFKLAIDHCQKSLTLAEEIEILATQVDACQCLFDTYKSLGDGEKALLYLEKVQMLNKRLNAEETAKKLEQMEFAKVMMADSIAKAEEARLIEEEHREEVRQKNQTRNALLGAVLLLMVLAGGLYICWRYVRKSKAILQVEKDRSENLLLNILPEEIAQELKEKGKADARHFEMVSILFTDFKGFTEQSAKLSATELVTEINHCFEAFDSIMEKYGIEKIKTIGDAYMAAGGLPVPSDDSVKNAVLAALEMQAFIINRKAENESSGKAAFEMRVGIYTGPVVAGIVGVKKFQYDIWGDTVNTASLMENSGKVGKVNISQTTYELLKNDADLSFESRGKIEAKGKGEMEMYFVSKA